MKVISISRRMKSGIFDDDYTLFENGEVLHEYDKHMYPGGHNLKETLSIDQLGVNIKKRLLDDTSEENKDLVRKMLGLD